ncbi:MAG TPA: diacylglycerol kinase family protein [Casimicrobiaceae bacterium]|nr:diacylglycerol kinase family protein [Casimicrobiaceae bacterium]
MGSVSPEDLALLTPSEERARDATRAPVRRALLVANPASRSGRRRLPRAVAALEKAGVQCEVAFTERPGHAAELVRERHQGHDAVFTLGGDGTAMEAAGALAGTMSPLGVLAGGTGNLLARAVGIPLDPKRAIPMLLGGEVLHIDLGRIVSCNPVRHFAVAAGVGIDAAMVAETPSWLKRRLGVLAYTITATRAALRSVLRQEFFHVRLTVDGEVFEAAAAAVMIANFGAVLSDRITFGPGIRFDDGVLDACFYSPRNMRDATRIMWRLLRRDFTSDDAMLYRSGRHIRVETTPPRLAQADGELLGMTPLEIEIAPQAVRLLVPKQPTEQPSTMPPRASDGA